MQSELSQEIEHQKLAALDKLWRKKCGAKSLPELNDLDVFEGGEDFYFRLHGKNIVNLYGLEMRGKYISELTEEIRATIFWEHRGVMQRRGPVLIQRKHVHPGWEYTKIINLLLPLSPEGEKINQTFSCSYPER